MKGDAALIKQRVGGFKPSGVWISHAPTPYWNTWSKFNETFDYPEIQILQYENPDALDLRFVVGLTVHVSGCKNYQKAKRLHDSLVDAKAYRVLTVCNGILIDSWHGEFDDYVPE
jgi:hypothetical protein